LNSSSQFKRPAKENEIVPESVCLSTPTDFVILKINTSFLSNWSLADEHASRQYVTATGACCGGVDMARPLKAIALAISKSG